MIIEIKIQMKQILKCKKIKIIFCFCLLNKYVFFFYCKNLEHLKNDGVVQIYELNCLLSYPLFVYLLESLSEAVRYDNSMHLTIKMKKYIKLLQRLLLILMGIYCKLILLKSC